MVILMALEAYSISKSYDHRIILRNISFSIRKGELAVLLGPNGAGKTTILNIIAGIIEPDDGTIIIDNRVVFKRDNGETINVPPEKRNIGYVPQDYALFPHLTVYENIAFGLRAKRISESDIKKRVKELIEILGLQGLEHKYPKNLSGGEKQKVAIARALAPWPSVLLLDEPLSAIDPSSKDKIRVELKKILTHKDIRTTTLMVTHDLNDVWSLADRIIVLMDNTIIFNGVPGELFNNIKSIKQASFFSLNVLEGVVIDKSRKTLTVKLSDGKTIINVSTINIAQGIDIKDRVLVLFRPDDIVLTNNKFEENSYKAKVLSVRVTNCNVRLLLEVSGNIIIKAELGRGYLLEALGRIPAENTMINIRVPKRTITLTKLHR